MENGEVNIPKYTKQLQEVIRLNGFDLLQEVLESIEGGISVDEDGKTKIWVEKRGAKHVGIDSNNCGSGDC